MIKFILATDGRMRNLCNKLLHSLGGVGNNARLMAQLIVRNIEPDVVRQLQRNAAEHGRSAEEEHREILRNVLCPKRPAAPDFKTLLTSIPQGEDIFAREPDFGRPPPRTCTDCN
ncbi:MAG: hypothetical protein P4L83_08285 [Nevskia sp.]|nr:hypothetical protein [Nevskia sp.]